VNCADQVVLEFGAQASDVGVDGPSVAGVADPIPDFFQQKLAAQDFASAVHHQFEQLKFGGGQMSLFLVQKDSVMFVVD
jgi:hypothetical protein